MRILNRYLWRAVADMTGLVMLVLISLAGFIDFVSQLNDVGTGNFGVFEALMYVLLKLPRTAYVMLPMAALLGALLGLGGLASHSELIVMRAAGVSLGRLGRSVLLAGCILAVLGGILGEYIAPPLDRYARQMKAEAKSGGNQQMAGPNAWLRDGDSIFNVRRAANGYEAGGVFLFRLDGAGQLAGIGRAESAEVVNGNKWVLKELTETRFEADRIRVQRTISAPQAGELNPELLALTQIRESSLNALELYRYVRYLKRNGLDASRYEIGLWGRAANITGIAVMCLLALPFVLGSLRSTGAGSRLLVGALIGLVYYFVSQLMADSAAVYRLDPFLLAWLPTLLLTAVVALAFGRTR